jgi:hypothetical protein
VPLVEQELFTLPEHMKPKLFQFGQIVSEEKIFEKVYDNGLRMMAKAGMMTLCQMSQDNYKYTI